MSKFATLSQASGLNTFVNAELKKKLAANCVPFQVLTVSGPTEREFPNGRRTDTSMLYDLTIKFDAGDARDWGVPSTMTLSYTAGYDSRDERIEAIRDDLKDGITIHAIITYDPDFGRQGWYDIAPAGQEI